LTPSDNLPERENSGPAARPLHNRICGSGEMAERIRNYDWSSTGLGPIAGWPDALVVLVNALLANQLQMFLFWGDDLVQFYNDQSISILGPDKHPGALGQPAAECWAEIWDMTGPQLHSALQGRAVRNEDQYTPLHRFGKIDDAWFTYCYSPVRDADGTIRGVMVTTLETTPRVLAEKALQNERSRLLSLFEQSPAFFAVLRGPTHIFEMANPPYMRLVGGRDVLGKPLAEVIPEAGEQGYVGILDRVYQTGEPFIGQDLIITLSENGQPTSDRHVDFIYHPLREPDGTISGINVLGVDITERKQAAEALVRTEMRAASVLESITDGFHVIDSAGRFAQFNAAGRAIYAAQGVDADALIGVPVLNAFPELRSTPIGAAVFATLEQHEPTSIESWYAPWNRWFWVRNYPTADGGVATFFLDTTERKRAETLLKEQRERFAFATDAAQIGYWFCNLPFDKLIWDERVKQHFWLSPQDDVDIALFYRCLHPDDRQRTRKAIEHSIAHHERYEIEYRTLAPDGRQKWIRALGRTAYDDAGDPKRFDGVTQDVTALKGAREALDDERRRLATVFENLPLGLLFTEADGRVISLNPHAERILGRSLEQMHNHGSWYEVALHQDGARLESAEYPLTRALADGQIHSGQFLLERENGARIWVEETDAPLLDGQGNIRGAVVAIADIDARKRTEEALIRSEKLAVVGRLAATISHEINNPLEAVTNLLYLIQINSRNKTTARYSKAAQDELARVSHIVTHTLRFNRQSSVEMREKVSDLLESAVTIYEMRLKSAGIEVRRDYRDSAPIQCFGSELRQVFANLVGNSFDATRGGGILRVRTRDQVNWRTGESGVRVSIADTGQGMSPATRKRLFEPFFTTKGDSGTGLGLWISREILNKHRAVLHLKSRQSPPPTGTVFSIWLPSRIDDPRPQ
jgi:PAS domain S-box-containing protein